MMKHGETKQSQQSPLLTPGAHGANTDGHVTAFFNIDRLPSSPGDETSSTVAARGSFRALKKALVVPYSAEVNNCIRTTRGPTLHTEREPMGSKGRAEGASL